MQLSRTMDASSGILSLELQINMHAHMYLSVSLLIQETPLVRSVSMSKRGCPALPSSAIPSISRLKQLGEETKAACKSPATSCWLPWMPIPHPEDKQQPVTEKTNQLKVSGFSPVCAGRDTGALLEGRVRHRSEPQNFKEHPFPYDLDDESIRTSDV